MNENNVKPCERCKGSGRINERYEMKWENTSWVPTEGKYVERRVDDKCPDCDGKGKLTLKWVSNGN